MKLFYVAGPFSAPDRSGVGLSELITSHRFSVTSECELQAGVAEVLTQAGIKFEREVRLSGKDRVDFMVKRCAIELKVDGGTSEVIRQLHRYAQHDEVGEILLVTTRARHRQIPITLNEKPVTVAVLWGVL